jgi:UDP-N-acetylglucosamine:LPS N-acetylglucosamine transferase
MANLDVIRKSGVQVVWQTGSYYYREMLDRLKNQAPENLKVTEFLSRMDLAYAAADVVVSRAGAGTISELCLLGKPSVLVPSPNVAEDHQTKNAMALVENNGLDGSRQRSQRKIVRRNACLVATQTVSTSWPQTVEVAKPKVLKKLLML